MKTPTSKTYATKIEAQEAMSGRPEAVLEIVSHDQEDGTTRYSVSPYTQHTNERAARLSDGHLIDEFEAAIRREDGQAASVYRAEGERREIDRFEAESEEWAEAEKQDDRVRDFITKHFASLGAGRGTGCVLVHPDGAGIFFSALDSELNQDGDPNGGDPLEILADIDATDRAIIIQQTLAVVAATIALSDEIEKRVRSEKGE